MTKVAIDGDTSNELVELFKKSFKAQIQYLKYDNRLFLKSFIDIMNLSAKTNNIHELEDRLKDLEAWANSYSDSVIDPLGVFQKKKMITLPYEVANLILQSIKIRFVV